MTRRTLYSSSFDPLLIWSRLAFNIGETMLASAQVIGQRTNRMVMAGSAPTATDQRELALMGQEKIAAVVESTQAMALGLTSLHQQIGALVFKQILTGTTAMMSLAMSRTTGESIARQARFVRDTLSDSAAATSQISASTARVVNKGLRPIRSRVKGNAARLAKR